MKKLLVLLFAFFAVFVLAACDSNEDDSYIDIDNDDLREMLETPEDFTFLDVRTKDEYDTAHVPGFDINLDYYQFKDNLGMLDGLDKTKPIVVMCRSGNRSVSASLLLIDEGFENVYNVEEGINGWDGETE